MKNDSKSQKKKGDKKESKLKKGKGDKKESKLKKGKDYKSSEDRSVKEKDPKNVKVKIKYEATKPGGRGPRGEFYTQ